MQRKMKTVLTFFITILLTTMVSTSILLLIIGFLNGEIHTLVDSIRILFLAAIFSIVLSVLSGVVKYRGLKRNT